MIYYAAFAGHKVCSEHNKDKDNEDEKMSKFKVTITRKETYTHEVDVDAENEEQAESIVRQREQDNEFAEQFGCPDDVETHFEARDIGDPTRTYTLPELADKVDIDAWVEGISAMCAMDEIRKEVYDMAGMVEDEDNPICPGEFETEYTELAEKYKFRFNRKGQIVSYNLKAGDVVAA